MGWGAALEDLKKETNEARWARCETMANGVRALFTDLGFSLLADSGQRSNSVTAILYPEGVDDAWRAANSLEVTVSGFKFGFNFTGELLNTVSPR